MPMQMKMKQCFNLSFEQKKRQKKKTENDLDDDMDIEPQMKYKGTMHSTVRRLLKQRMSTVEVYFKIACFL